MLLLKWKPHRNFILHLALAGIILQLTACLPGRKEDPPAHVTQPAASAVTETPVPAAPSPTKTGGFGVLGDSTSDEYRADDARGGEYGATTLGWVEQLVESRNLNFGRWAVWDEPRRTGYEYNWARSGATAQTILTGGQVTGLAEQVAQGKVSYVLLWIGGNDFHLLNGPYREIYEGTLNDSALQEKLDRFTADITTIMDRILAAGNAKMVVVTVTDQGLAQQAVALYPDPEKRQRVTDAINRLNAAIAQQAEARGVIVADSNQLAKELLSRYDSQGLITFGGKKINAAEQGNDPYHLQLADQIGHSGTILSGIIANKILIEPFNRAFNLGIQPLSEDEILHNAGISN